MPGQDGSRAISTIKFLLVSRSYCAAAAAAHDESCQQQLDNSAAVLLAHLTGCTRHLPHQDDKAPGTKLEHTWNAHLKAACRDDARDSMNFFTSDSEESADATEGPTSSTALQDAAPAHHPRSAATTEGPRQPTLPAEAAAGGPAPACPAGNPQAAPSTPAQDTTAASTVQESVNATAADSSLAAPSCTPLQLSGSSGSTGSSGAETVPEQPANADPAGASTAAGPSTPALSPMQGATGAKPAAEAPTPLAQVAEGGCMFVLNCDSRFLRMRMPCACHEIIKQGSCAEVKGCAARRHVPCVAVTCSRLPPHMHVPPHLGTVQRRVQKSTGVSTEPSPSCGMSRPAPSCHSACSHPSARS